MSKRACHKALDDGRDARSVGLVLEHDANELGKGIESEHTRRDRHTSDGCVSQGARAVQLG